MASSGKNIKGSHRREEALSSTLMGLFEKRRFKNFLVYVQELDVANPATWKDIAPTKTTMEEVSEIFGLDDNNERLCRPRTRPTGTTTTRIQPCLEAVERIKLSSNSWQNTASPLPVSQYGLGEVLCRVLPVVYTAELTGC